MHAAQCLCTCQDVGMGRKFTSCPGCGECLPRVCHGFEPSSLPTCAGLAVHGPPPAPHALPAAWGGRRRGAAAARPRLRAPAHAAATPPARGAGRGAAGRPALLRHHAAAVAAPRAMTRRLAGCHARCGCITRAPVRPVPRAAAARGHRGPARHLALMVAAEDVARCTS
jgi:hypothetical protein